MQRAPQKCGIRHHPRCGRRLRLGTRHATSREGGFGLRDLRDNCRHRQTGVVDQCGITRVGVRCGEGVYRQRDFKRHLLLLLQGSRIPSKTAALASCRKGSRSRCMLASCAQCPRSGHCLRNSPTHPFLCIFQKGSICFRMGAVSSDTPLRPDTPSKRRLLWTHCPTLHTGDTAKNNSKLSKMQFRLHVQHSGCAKKCPSRLTFAT